MVIAHLYEGVFYTINTVTNQKERTLEGHLTAIKTLAFTKDGKFLLSRSPTETIVWDT